jgi:hypothetical protein
VRVGLITQCDEQAACDFALLVHHAPVGSPDRTAALEWRVRDRSLRLEAAVTLGHWHHLTYSADFMLLCP